jgi:hypothetical protein
VLDDNLRRGLGQSSVDVQHHNGNENEAKSFFEQENLPATKAETIVVTQGVWVDAAKGRNLWSEVFLFGQGRARAIVRPAGALKSLL